MASYRDLKVWQAGMRLAVQVYRLTEAYPGDEKYGLVSQMRRSAVSVPSNIAEGHGRNSANEMIRFAGIVLGSCAELETQLLLSQELNYGDSSTIDSLLGESEGINRMLHGLIRSNRDRS